MTTTAQPTKPAITAALCEPNDFPAVADIAFDSLGHGNIIKTIYPDCHLPENRAKYAASWLRMAERDRSHRWLKAVDVSTGEIIGMSVWDVYPTAEDRPRDDSLQGIPQPAYLSSFQEGENVLSSESREYAEALVESLMDFRRQVIRGAKGPVVCLSLMAVSPKHRRKGAGDALMTWGTSLADQLGAECVVEASPEGRLLYERHGFIVRKHEKLALSEKYADKPEIVPAHMYRPPKGQPN